MHVAWGDRVGDSTRVRIASGGELRVLKSLMWCIVGVVVAAGAACAEGGTWPPVGELPGSEYLFGVAVQGQYAYVSGHGRLRVIDVSSPTDPRETGRCDTPADPYGSAVSYGVAVAGDYAYVAANYDGLRIVDISDPAAPVEVGSCDTAIARNVVVAGQYAYVADDIGGLRVIDISDPGAPAEVGCWYVYDPWGFPMLSAQGVAVSGDRAYVADQGEGLYVLDVSDPENPVEVGSIEIAGFACDVAVSGQYAYLVGWNAGLRLIDISTPSSPVQVGECSTFGSPHGVALSGSCAYVANGGGGRRLMDISEPTAPARMGGWPIHGESWDVAVSGSYAYVADRFAGFRVIDVSDPWAPLEVGSLYTEGWACGVEVWGDTAYVAARYSGLRVADISDRAAPVEVGRCSDWPARLALDVTASNGYAYLAGDMNGMSVVDVTDPTNPTLMGLHQHGGCGAFDVRLRGQYAYVTYGHPCAGALAVVDVLDPADPVGVGSYDYEWGAAFSGQYAYVGDGISGGLRVLDASDPADLVEVGGCDTPGDARHIAISEPYAYVADRYKGVSVVEISDPENPVLVGTCDTPGDTYGVVDVAVWGRYVYAADGETGLRVIDVSDPANPAEVAYWETSGHANDVVTDGSYVYLTDYHWGLLIFPVYAASAPAAQFSGSPTLGSAPLTVEFTDLSAYDPTSWSWDFGDGGTSTLQSPSHEYASPGRYAVSLTAGNARGTDTETKANYVTVTFDDVQPGDWAFEEILACVDAGVVGGYEDGLYHGDWDIARDQMAVFIARAMCGGEAEVPDPPCDGPPFPDVPCGSWASPHIQYIVSQGVAAGYDDGYYRPESIVLRDQMAVFMARVLCGGEDEVPDVPCDRPPFPDVSCEFWARKHIEHILSKGVTRGCDDGLYHPEMACTRDQMAVYIARAFDL